MTTPAPGPAPVGADVGYQVRREMLQTALIEARDGGLPLIFAGGIVAWIGSVHGVPIAGAIVLGLSIVVAAWRFWLCRRVGTGDISDAEIRRGERQFEGNAVLTGLMSVITAGLIFPAATGPLAVLVIAVVCAMLAVATMYVVLVGRAFEYYAVPQLIALLAVSLLDSRIYSPVMAIAVPVFYATLRRAAQRHRIAIELAIRHRIETDAANAAKTQFLANMSHELRTPVNGVLGALDLMGRAELPVEQRHLLDTATSSGEALLTLLNEVLDFAKIEAGKLELVDEPVKIRAVLMSVANLFTPMVERKGLTLMTHFDPDLPLLIRGDASRVRQVLVNLVGNAIKFTDRGGIVVRARRAPGDKNTRPAALLEVEDTGIGMAPDVIPRLFSAFFQADQSNERRFGGTGLGLAISRRLAEAMGAQLSVESVPGHGSTFTLSLPIEEVAEVREPQGTAVAAARPSAQLGGHVLLVEDNPVNRMLTGMMLKKMGIGFTEAENGALALQELQRVAVDLVLMDCQMPVMDGFSATREIRERERLSPSSRMPIVAVTANALNGDAERCFQAGMDAYLAKPFTLDQLRDTIAPWLKAD